MTKQSKMILYAGEPKHLYDKDRFYDFLKEIGGTFFCDNYYPKKHSEYFVVNSVSVVYTSSETQEQNQRKRIVVELIGDDKEVMKLESILIGEYKKYL